MKDSVRAAVYKLLGSESLLQRRSTNCAHFLQVIQGLRRELQESQVRVVRVVRWNFMAEETIETIMHDRLLLRPFHPSTPGPCKISLCLPRISWYSWTLLLLQG